MRSLIVELPFAGSPDPLLPALANQPGTILLCSGSTAGPHARYSFLATRPFLLFQSRGSRCEVSSARGRSTWFGNPWNILNDLLNRYEVRDEMDQPFPLGGAFGYWGYDLRHHVEPRLPHRHLSDHDLPETHLGFHDSLVVFDHALAQAFIVATGLRLDGSRSLEIAQRQIAFWQELLAAPVPAPAPIPAAARSPGHSVLEPRRSRLRPGRPVRAGLHPRRRYLSGQSRAPTRRRLARSWTGTVPAFARGIAGALCRVPRGLETFNWHRRRRNCSSGSADVRSRRAPSKAPVHDRLDPVRDAQLAYELQTSPKELAELLMITDLLRNDLGRICEYGSITVPDLARLEKFPQVQHLVATVEGQLRPRLSHLEALAQCFPGGSVTGAPKIRAMEIIDELEPVGRGPYTGALGYLGFNGESQLSILIRTAVVAAGRASFHTGAGIVADSSPEAEYAETLAKAGGFLRAVSHPARACAISDTDLPAAPTPFRPPHRMNPSASV